MKVTTFAEAGQITINQLPCTFKTATYEIPASLPFYSHVIFFFRQKGKQAHDK